METLIRAESARDRAMESRAESTSSAEVSHRRRALEEELFALESELSYIRSARVELQDKTDEEELGAEVRNQQLRNLVEKQRSFLTKAREHMMDYEQKQSRLQSRLETTEEAVSKKEQYCNTVLQRALEVEAMARRVQEAINHSKELPSNTSEGNNAMSAVASKKKKKSVIMTKLKSLANKWHSSGETRMESLAQDINEARKRNASLRESINSTLKDLSKPEKYDVRPAQPFETFASFGGSSGALLSVA